MTLSEDQADIEQRCKNFPQNQGPTLTQHRNYFEGVPYQAKRMRSVETGIRMHSHFAIPSTQKPYQVLDKPSLFDI